MLLFNCILSTLSVIGIFAWENLPNIPTGRRSQYFLLNDNGQYKYGYDTGTGIAAKQFADSANEVQGHYFYKSADGKSVDLKYTAGVKGFIPGPSDTVTSNSYTSADSFISHRIDNSPQTNPQSINVNPSAATPNTDSSLEYANLNPDGSYSFGFTTNDQSRQESADSKNNVQGSYSYKNSAGTHDLSYIAGAESGFKTTGGSLSVPNGLFNPEISKIPTTQTPNTIQSNEAGAGSSGGTLAYGNLNPDGSYSFGFTTNEQSRQESADSKNNVQGSYSYKNSAGTHDLSYIAGAESGFKTTGGSLSVPNGLFNPEISKIPTTQSPNTIQSNHAEADSSGGTLAYGHLNPDGSYSFGFNTNEQSRQESADSKNNVQGSYSYKNSAGTHDLSYIAGAESGFKTTGGSLSVPNGLFNPEISKIPTTQTPNTIQSNAAGADSSGGTLTYGNLNPDGSYSFGFTTNEQSRQESADSKNNVQGSYSYKNSAGTHDLSYIAGAESGFKTTGGSLSVPNGLFNPEISKIPTTQTPNTIQSNESGADSSGGTLAYGNLNPDGTYSFGFNTNEQSRQESADSKNNVQGSYSYKNSAGTHDLSYIAGAESGFKTTGGSLSVPNGLFNPEISKIPTTQTPNTRQSNEAKADSSDGTLAYGNLNPDGSYSFGFTTNDHSRQESADSKNNVQGSYSFQNSAGIHDLSYVAGTETGFKPIGGSLSIPNGLTGQASSATTSVKLDTSTGTQISTAYGSMPATSWPQNENNKSPSQGTETGYQLGNLMIYTYLPPSNEKNKFGYIFDTKS